LKGVYKNAALVQDGQAPPPSFKEYKKNENAGGVMGMIHTIINDAKTMKAEAIRAEEDNVQITDLEKPTDLEKEIQEMEFVEKRELTEEERVTLNMGGTLAPTAAPGGTAGLSVMSTRKSKRWNSRRRAHSLRTSAWRNSTPTRSRLNARRLRSIQR